MRLALCERESTYVEDGMFLGRIILGADRPNEKAIVTVDTVWPICYLRSLSARSVLPFRESYVSQVTCTTRGCGVG
jgi:hypothetical protein